jgi:hypothetical protein
MDEFVKIIMGGLLSGTVISSVMGVLLARRTSRLEAEIKEYYERATRIFESHRNWKERAVAELLGPLYLQFDRTKRAFDVYTAANTFLEAKVLRDGNLVIRDLLLAKTHLIPPDLLGDAGDLVEHYDRWLEEFERVRNEKRPDLTTPFVFVGPKGYLFPRNAETKFREAFKEMRNELYDLSKPHMD